MRSTRTAYILWLLCLFGFCGIHRFYAGKVATGLLWLFTVGLLGIGQLVDLFLIPSMIERANAQLGHGPGSHSPAVPEKS
jgi:TM2 domain-containing membrane protein YozV